MIIDLFNAIPDLAAVAEAKDTDRANPFAFDTAAFNHRKPTVETVDVADLQNGLMESPIRSRPGGRKMSCSLSVICSI